MREGSPLIEAEYLKKSFPPNFVFAGRDISIGYGETVAFLGANGSGKSTLFELLTGNMDASEGEVFFRGERLLPERFLLKRQIGYLPQIMHLPKWVTACEILSYASSLYGLSDRKQRVKESLAFWDCEEFQKRPLAVCSFGMQKRVGLALATLHDPICLVLDEPFSGLDLYHIHTLEQAIQRRHAEGKSTLLSTHILSFVVKLCRKVFLLDEGLLSPLIGWDSLSSEEKEKRIERHFF
ncbi:MAG: ABC transporter ATP-binding protein [Deltaproteobacteria bacterium]|nr:ABC transporter ATP-binding protein [Deltaproteobacteria bacterium]